MGIGVTVARLTLDQLVKVRILDPQLSRNAASGFESDLSRNLGPADLLGYRRISGVFFTFLKASRALWTSG